MVLELGNPRYKRKTRTVRYPARVLDAATGNLSHLEPRRDDGVPRRFRVASLFIDDAGYGLPAGCQPGLPYIKCTYTSSTTLSLDSMISAMNNALGPQNQIDSTTPLWIQAWGGRGATGASSGDNDGAFGGYAGYAINVSWVGTLGGEELYVYVGASGSRHANYSGQGGGSTIVSTELLSEIDPSLDGLLVAAGGSGGGGRASRGSAAAAPGARRSRVTHPPTRARPVGSAGVTRAAAGAGTAPAATRAISTPPPGPMDSAAMAAKGARRPRLDGSTWTRSTRPQPAGPRARAAGDAAGAAAAPGAVGVHIPAAAAEEAAGPAASSRSMACSSTSRRRRTPSRQTASSPWSC